MSMYRIVLMITTYLRQTIRLNVSLFKPPKGYSRAIDLRNADAYLEAYLHRLILH